MDLGGRARFGEGDPALFIGREGRRLTARAVDLIVRRLGEEANLDAPVSAHVLRHTCLTNLVRNGNDLVMVAEIAGHKRLRCLKRYIARELYGVLLSTVVPTAPVSAP